MKNLLDSGLLRLRDEYPIGIHPTAETAQSRFTAQFEHPAQVLTCNELPGGTEQVCTNYTAFVEILLKSLCRRLYSPHSNRPSHHPVILGLHCTHPLHDVVR